MIASRFSDLWLSQSELRQRFQSRRAKDNKHQPSVDGEWTKIADDDEINTFQGKQNDHWMESSCREGRPRFYDRFYTKTPGNFHVESESSLPNSASNTSSKSAIRPRRVTREDVKRIERRLSLKKTIRKQVMRDLSQAPNLALDQQDNEDNDENNDDNERRSRSSGNLLEMLKEGHDNSDDSGIGNHTPPLILKNNNEDNNNEDKMGLASARMDSALLETSVSIPRARWSRSDWETLEMAHDQLKNNNNNNNNNNKNNNKGLSRLKSFLLIVKPSHNNKSRS